MDLIVIIFFKLVCGWLFISIGIFFITSALLGVLRFPEVYTRAHAAGVSDSFGVPILLLGLAFLQSSIIMSLKLVFLTLIMLVLSPASTHALIKLAWLNKMANYTKTANRDG